MVPEVAVPEVSEDPIDFVDVLERHRYSVARVFDLRRDLIRQFGRARPCLPRIFENAESLEATALEAALGPLPKTPLADGVAATIERFRNT